MSIFQSMHGTFYTYYVTHSITLDNNSIYEMFYIRVIKYFIVRTIFGLCQIMRLLYFFKL